MGTRRSSARRRPPSLAAVVTESSTPDPLFIDIVDRAPVSLPFGFGDFCFQYQSLLIFRTPNIRVYGLDPGF